MNTSGESACKKAPVPRLLTTVSTERRRGLFNLFGFFASLADDFVERCHSGLGAATCFSSSAACSMSARASLFQAFRCLKKDLCGFSQLLKFLTHSAGRGDYKV